MDERKSTMDLEKYLVVKHPQILKRYQESKENPQPKSAPANLPHSQFFASPLNSPILPTHEFFPEIVYPKSPPLTLSSASTQMSSPTKTIPETQLSPILPTHEFSPEIVYPRSPSPTLSTQMSSPTKTIPETQFSQSPSQSPPKYKYKPGLSEEDLMQYQNRL